MPNFHEPTIIDRATEIYRAVLLQCELRRQEIGWSMWQLDDAAGLNDGHFGHCLHCDRPSGRQASWKILNLIVTALWPRGFDLQVTDKPGGALTAEDMHRKILHAAAPYNRVAQRKLMSTLGKKSAKARKEKFAAMSEEERKRAVNDIVKKARATRRKNKLLRTQAVQATPQIKRVQSSRKPCVVNQPISGPSCPVGAIGAPAE